MLGKLLKYEYKATARWLLPLYGATIVVAILNRFLFADAIEVNNMLNIKQIAQFLSMTLYVFLMVGIMAVTVVVIIQRFYKSLLGDEGYLMFTLPVKTWKHILNKLLIATLWIIVSGVVGFGSILLILPGNELSEFGLALREFRGIFGAAGYITLPLLILVSIIFSILQMYAAIALGQLFNKHKLLASFGMYLAINTACQFLSLLLLPLFGNTFVKPLMSHASPMPTQINTLFIVLIVFNGVLLVASFILTKMLLQKKLNLE